jgi:hypothetical protein
MPPSSRAAPAAARQRNEEELGARWRDDPLDPLATTTAQRKMPGANSARLELADRRAAV